MLCQCSGLSLFPKPKYGTAIFTILLIPLPQVKSVIYINSERLSRKFSCQLEGKALVNTQQMIKDVLRTS